MNLEEKRIGEAIAAWLDRKAGGGDVSLDRFCAAYPEIAAELREQLSALESMGGRSTADSPTASAAPSQLSGYRIVRELGRGGMGAVFLAMDDKLGRPVAIKMLAERHQSNQRLRERFLHEARAMAQLTHPNIVRIYGLGPDNEPPHFVMEYIEGVSLTDATGKLPLHQKVQLLLRVIEAVEFLHRRHFVHRDLKPANILVDKALDPKVVDFGLALEMEELAARLTRPGELMVTPWYMSPEQARGASTVDARSDVFALGVILYELITGVPPFRETSLDAQIRHVCDDEPILPRRLNTEIPGSLQDICLQAMEKDPAGRYASAAELARDLERFLAGEPVLAAPSSYSRRVGSQIQGHLADIEGWRQDRVLLPTEYDRLHRAYEKLTDRDDAWILEARRLSLPQVALYFGGWMVLAAALLVSLLQHSGWDGWPARLAVWAAAVPPLILGLRFWRRGQLRIGIAFLLSFCLILPAAWLLTLPAHPQQESREILLRYKELRSHNDLRLITNVQMWWALALSLPVYAFLRRFTKASAFSLVVAIALALLSIVTLLRLGLLEWLADDFGRAFLYLLPIAAIFFLTAFVLEQSKNISDARYFYPLGVAFTLLGFSGLASFHDPYAQWIRSVAPFTRGKVEYLFLLNASIYLVLQELCDRFGSEQLRSVGRAFRFVLPGHVMGSLLFLGISASINTARLNEARFFEVLLPLVAALFVFGSIPKQMKNFFATGLLFFAIGVVRLANDWLRDQALWPLLLLLAGLGTMLVAAHYSRVKLFFQRK